VDERRSKRIPAEVGCWLLQGDDVSCFHSFDISSTGISLATDEPLPEGKVVKLQFYTPHSAKAITVDAEVIWSRHDPQVSGMGLKFLGEESRATTLLAQLAVLMQGQRKG